MRTILILVVLLVVTATQALVAQSTDRPAIEMQNMHLTFDVYLSNQPKSRGLSAAAWLRLRNNTGVPVRNLTLLLNPGLKVTKIVGAKNANLKYTIANTSLGENGPALQVIKVTLPTALKKNNSTEFSVQYQGDPKSLGSYGATWPLDTLTPDFTMIRPESFIYPIISEASLEAFDQYKKNQRFSPTARITVPQGYSLAGNATETSRNLKGTREEIEVRTLGKSYGLVLGLARYNKILDGPFRLFYLAENSANAKELATKANAIIETLANKLGDPSKSKAYVVSDLDNAYQATNGPSHAFINFGDYSSVPLETALPSLWEMKNYSGETGGWHIAINQLASDGMNSLAIFDKLKSFLESDKKTQKLGLMEYAEAGHAETATDGYLLLFTVLKELIGKDDFWTVIKSFRSEFADFGANDDDLLDYMKRSLENRKARKLVIDWIDKGRIMRDLKASENFEALVNRYK